MGNFIGCCNGRRAMDVVEPVALPGVVRREQSTLSDRPLLSNRSTAAHSLNINALLTSMRVDLASKGFFCALFYDGTIIETNHRIQMFTNLTAQSAIRTDFFELISPSARVEVRDLFSHLSSRSPLLHDRSVPVSLPFIVKESTKTLKGETLLASDGVLFFISNEELQNIEDPEIIKIKNLILKHRNEGLWLTDNSGIITNVAEPNCMQNLGYQEEDLVGRNIQEFIFPGDTTPLQQVDSPSPQIPERSYEVRRIHKWGASIRAKVVESSITLASGERRRIFIDTYIPLFEM